MNYRKSRKLYSPTSIVFQVISKYNVRYYISIMAVGKNCIIQLLLNGTYLVTNDYDFNQCGKRYF